MWTISKQVRSVKGNLGDLYAESGQTLQGSFSAVSKPILQVNTRWKALAEIYTMHSFAPLSNLKIFVKNCWIFCCFFPKFRKFCQNFAEFSPNLTKFFRDFSKMQHISKIFKMCNIFLGIFSKNCRFFRKKAGFSGHETAKKVIVSITYRTSCRYTESPRGRTTTPSSTFQPCRQ